MTYYQQHALCILHGNIFFKIMLTAKFALLNHIMHVHLLQKILKSHENLANYLCKIVLTSRKITILCKITSNMDSEYSVYRVIQNWVNKFLGEARYA